MPQSVTLHLEPDPEQAAKLHGKDYGLYAAKAPGGSTIDYEITSYIVVHGHIMANDKKERASLLVFKVKATSPRRRPIKEMKVELTFKMGGNTAKANPTPVPRLLRILPSEQGYKLQCKQGTAKYNSRHGGSVAANAGTDFAGVNAEGHKETSEELEQPVEFYAFVQGKARASKRGGQIPNLGLWTFEGSTPNKGSMPKGAVPPVSHIAMILLRPTDGLFTCEARVHIEVDFRWSVENKTAQLYNSLPGPLTFDPEVQEQSEYPIDMEKLNDYKEEAKLKELVEILLPVEYDEWKYGKAPVEEDE